MRMFLFFVFMLSQVVAFPQNEKPFTLHTGAGVGFVNYSINQIISNKWLAQNGTAYPATLLFAEINRKKNDWVFTTKFNYRHWWTTISFENLNTTEDIPVNGYPWPFITSGRYDFRQIALAKGFKHFINHHLYLLAEPELVVHFKPYRRIKQWNPQIPSMVTNKIVNDFDKSPKTLFMNVRAGLGIKINRFQAELSYLQAVTNQFNVVEYRAQTNARQGNVNQIILTLAYQIKEAENFKRLFKSKKTK